ncbi:MAG: diguanylate cyclase [Proteobacteria bacterium]|nr:diguanylate cyclase [Pseudomonadota bacterium]NOG59698.1 diguanylate cyclase [Pseudomonadota bacterium]
MATADMYTENIKTKTSTGTLDVNYPDQSIKKTIVENNQDLNYLYKQAPAGIILTIISALLVSWFVLPSVPDYIYVPWLAFIVLTAFTHTLIIKEFSKNKNTLHVNNQWAVYHTIMVGTTGLAFSIGYILFLPLLSTFSQIILLLILATLAVAFLPILSVFLPAYIIYISAFIFPIVFWIYNLPPDKAYPIATLLAITYCMLIVISSYYSKALLEAFGLAGEVSGQVKYLYEIIDKTKTLNVNLKKDIYEYIKKNNSVSKEKEQAEITLQAIGEGVISTDQLGRINYINPVAEIYTGWELKDAKGMYLSSILNLVDETTHIKLPNPVEQCLEKNITVNSSDATRLIRRDGLEYAIEYSTTPVMEGKIASGSVMIFRDVTEKRTMQKTLDWQAKHDSLTGLINRREFDSRLNKIISSTSNSEREHALCFIDLDRFKIINDSCGHQAGDELLKKISARLKKIARDTDTIARLGGDEFAVLMYSCNIDKARLIAEIFKEEAFNVKFDWHGKHFSITASIGIVPLNESTESLTELQRVADLVCYKAKDAGGNRIEVYEEGKTEQQKHSGELKILEELQDNLEKEKFKIYTQQIQPLDSLNDTIFHEVLLRMNNSEGELLAANNFLHTAENYHMLSAIDDWVLKVIMELIAYGSPLFNKAHIISINISQQSIFNENFIKHAVNMFDEYNIPAGNICFEINQCQFDGSMDTFKRFVTLIKRQGCKIALDNFNYNPGSINLIKQLDVNFIKIDAREFGDINDSKNYNYQLLESVNGINHLVGAQTIIKCIDNPDIIDSLFEIGTDYIQGYSVEAPQALNNN